MATCFWSSGLAKEAECLAVVLRFTGVAGTDKAATVFLDPLMVFIPDEEHSKTEERWITIGQTENSKLLLVAHTYLEISSNVVNVRMISARLATKHEQRNMRQSYETGI